MEGKQTSEGNEVPAAPTRATSPCFKKIRTGWIYALSKRDLEDHMRECGLDPQGTVEELRRRFSTFINEREYTTQVGQHLMALEYHYNRTTTPRESLGAEDPQGLVVPGEGRNSPYFQIPTATVEVPGDRSQGRRSLGVTDRASRALPFVDDRTFDRVRAWAIRFDHGEDPIDFLERVEELAYCQRIPLDQIPFTLSEVLGGRALAWWRNRRHDWRDWVGFKSAFLKYFLPNTYSEDLDDRIRGRVQRESEPFSHFALELETLTRHARFTPRQQLDRIYQNSHPELRLLLKRHEFTTLDELTDLVAHIERVKAEIPRRMAGAPRGHGPNPSGISQRAGRGSVPPMAFQRQRPEPAGPTNISNNRVFDNLAERCFRCAQTGHIGRSCQNPPVLFCWVCGKKEVRTRECCKSNTNTRLRSTKVVEQQISLPESLTEAPPTPEVLEAVARCRPG